MNAEYQWLQEEARETGEQIRKRTENAEPGALGGNSEGKGTRKRGATA